MGERAGAKPGCCTGVGKAGTGQSYPRGISLLGPILLSSTPCSLREQRATYPRSSGCPCFCTSRETCCA